MKKRKPAKKGPHVVRLHTEDKKVIPAMMPGSYVNSLMSVRQPVVIRKVEYIAPLEETGWQKFLKWFW